MRLRGRPVLFSYPDAKGSALMKRWLKTIGGVLLFLFCLLAWLVAAMDYGDSVATGTYTFKRNGESSVLTLNPDHTFHQTRRLGNDDRHAEGTWRREGEGYISFSKEFLVVTGDEPEPDGTTFCEMHKMLGLFTSLRMRQYHVLWYGKTSAGNSPVGAYKGDEPNVTATLSLNEDHSFVQTLTYNDVTKQANGTWSQDTNGTVWFSRQFLKTSGESLSSNELASSIDPRGSNLQIEISVAEHLAEPVFRKRLGLF
jgi:hypothetical protein